MVTEIERFESTHLTSLDFCLLGWKNSEVYKRKVDTRDKLSAHILDSAARIKKRADQLRRKKKRDLGTGVAKVIEADGKIFEYLL